MRIFFILDNFFNLLKKFVQSHFCTQNFREVLHALMTTTYFFLHNNNFFRLCHIFREKLEIKLWFGLFFVWLKKLIENDLGKAHALVVWIENSCSGCGFESRRNTYEKVNWSKQASDSLIPKQRAIHANVQLKIWFSQDIYSFPLFSDLPII